MFVSYIGGGNTVADVTAQQNMVVGAIADGESQQTSSNFTIDRAASANRRLIFLCNWSHVSGTVRTLSSVRWRVGTSTGSYSDATIHYQANAAGGTSGSYTGFAVVSWLQPTGSTFDALWNMSGALGTDAVFRAYGFTADNVSFISANSTRTTTSNTGGTVTIPVQYGDFLICGGFGQSSSDPSPNNTSLTSESGNLITPSGWGTFARYESITGTDSSYEVEYTCDAITRTMVIASIFRAN